MCPVQKPSASPSGPVIIYFEELGARLLQEMPVPSTSAALREKAVAEFAAEMREISAGKIKFMGTTSRFSEAAGARRLVISAEEFRRGFLDPCTSAALRERAVAEFAAEMREMGVTKIKFMGTTSRNSSGLRFLARGMTSMFAHVGAAVRASGTAMATAVRNNPHVAAMGVAAAPYVASVARHPVAAAVVSGLACAGVAHLSGLDASRNSIVRAASSNIFGLLDGIGVFSLKDQVRRLLHRA